MRLRLPTTLMAVSILVLLPLASPASAQTSPRIPLRAGLTIVTALNEPERGDYESIKTITRVTDTDVQLKYSSEAPAPASSGENPLAALLGGANGPPAQNSEGKDVLRVDTTRMVTREDLENAHEYRLHFSNNAPASYPGSTAVGLSARLLNDLRAGQAVALTVPAFGLAGALGNMLGAFLGGSSKELDEATMLSGTLTRVESAAVPFNVLVNDEPTTLPAVHARGRLGDEAAEFWILDDAENPLSLKWTIGEGRLQVVKLSFPPDATTTRAAGARAGAGATAAGGGGAGGESATAARIERELEKEGRSVVYGIYFDFASDRIKEESEPVLEEIATVMTNNPSWNLTVEGHTDSIGSNDANLDLSRRRATAVRRALGDRYHVAAARLASAGFGESRPKDTNETLEGRARNRRVELARVK